MRPSSSYSYRAMLLLPQTIFGFKTRQIWLSSSSYCVKKLRSCVVSLLATTCMSCTLLSLLSGEKRWASESVFKPIRESKSITCNVTQIWSGLMEWNAHNVEPELPLWPADDAETLSITTARVQQRKDQIFMLLVNTLYYNMPQRPWNRLLRGCFGKDQITQSVDWLRG